MKTCSKCKVFKPETEFSKHTGTRDGLQAWCKSCKSIAKVEDRVKHPEKIKAGNAKYRAENRDRRNANSRAWNAANPARVKANTSKWLAANREKVRAKTAEWRAANPEARRIYDHNRRAREAGGKLSIDITEKLFTLQRGKCACGCKQPLGDNFHRDHIMPLALGGANEDWNMQLLRQRCNNQKYAKHPIDFMQSRGFLL